MIVEWHIAVQLFHLHVDHTCVWVSGQLGLMFAVDATGVVRGVQDDCLLTDLIEVKALEG